MNLSKFKNKVIIQTSEYGHWVDIIYSESGDCLTFYSPKDIVAYGNITKEEILLCLRESEGLSIYEKHRKEPLTEEEWMRDEENQGLLLFKDKH